MTLILAIESSCDETACAIVRADRTVLSNVIASQHDLHREYGGVVPEIASRAHVQRIIPVIDKALAEAGVSQDQIAAVAVGNRPGLVGSLLVGIAAAKAAAWSLGKPLIAIDHIQAHLYAGLLDTNPTDLPTEQTFPALGLVVSGGHTASFYMTDPLSCQLLGSTIDDAVGEAYDKAGAILGLPHPGGPKIDKLAQAGNDRAFDFPISRLDKASLDFSYSGLKTAVLYAVRGIPKPPAPGEKAAFQRDHQDLTDAHKADIAASFQRAAVRALILKLQRALDSIKDQPDAQNPVSLFVGGGVSANSLLRTEIEAFCDKNGLVPFIPRLEYCLDNAAMIAGLAHERLARADVDDLTITADPTPTRAVRR